MERQHMRSISYRTVVVYALATAASIYHGSASAEVPSPALVADLERGGFVILMRHASSPMTLPDAVEVAPGNQGRERQLDAQGKSDAQSFGNALRRLHIPVGRVLSSPTFRARETASLAGLHDVETAPALGEPDGTMMSPTSARFSAWLRNASAKRPGPRTNTVIITHMPNIAAVFPDSANGLSAGEALVLRPDGLGGDTVIARVRINEWPGAR
jgi:phosphohistidine phosphatase SixA